MFPAWISVVDIRKIPICMCDGCRRGFTNRLKRLKPRGPRCRGPQNFESNDDVQHFWKHHICSFVLLQRTFFYYATKKISLREWARRIEVNHDEHSLFLGLRIGYSYVCVEQHAWIHFPDYTRPVRYSKNM